MISNQRIEVITIAVLALASIVTLAAMLLLPIGDTDRESPYDVAARAVDTLAGWVVGGRALFGLAWPRRRRYRGGHRAPRRLLRV